MTKASRREVPAKPADELRELDWQHLQKVFAVIPALLENKEDNQAEVNARYVAEQLAALVKPRPVHKRKFEVVADPVQISGIYAENKRALYETCTKWFGEHSNYKAKFMLQLQCNECGHVFGTEREGKPGDKFDGAYTLDTLSCPDCNAKRRAVRAKERAVQLAELNAKPNPCAHCGQQCPDHRGTYCSVKCRVAAHRKRKREAASV